MVWIVLSSLLYSQYNTKILYVVLNMSVVVKDVDNINPITLIVTN